MVAKRKLSGWIAKSWAEDEKQWKLSESAAGVIVPGGFWHTRHRKADTCRSLRSYQEGAVLGLCLGSRLLAIRFARDVLKDPSLTSPEFDEREWTTANRRALPADQHKGKSMGGTFASWKI